LGYLEGVIRTRVGYTGGSTKNPTYHHLGDHTETVQVDFDPSVVTFEQLVEVFFASHNAWYGSADRQYMSAIFFHDADQGRVARAVKARVEQRTGRTLKTEIIAASTFYLGEEYHQKYALQGDKALLAEFRGMYPDLRDMVDSTAATRVNAYLYGYGSAEQLSAELDGLGLSAAGRSHLLEMGGDLKSCPIAG
jgi:peptide-methionine (S)-S-oxide reductase